MSTASDTQSPQNLSDWLDLLRQPTLPVNPAVKSAALHKLKASTGNADNVAHILEADPALALLLFHQANKSLALSGNESHSLSHCISLLGFPRVETLLTQTQDWDESAFTQLPDYRQQLLISLHAAHQCCDWAHLAPHWPDQELYWPSLFHRAPLWALWYRAGKQMEQLQYLRAEHRGAAHGQVEENLLGCTLQQLCGALSKSWHLPSVCQQSWQSHFSGDPRQWIELSRIDPEHALQALEESPSLQRTCHEPAFAVALANLLADQVEWDWYSRRSLRLQKILATAVHRPLPITITTSHRSAVTFSRTHSIAGTFSPAQQWFSHHRKTDQAMHLSLPQTPSRDVRAAVSTNTRTDINANTTASTTASSATAQVRPVQEPPAAFVKAIKQLKQAQSLSSLHEIMNLAVSTLCQSVGMERATACLLNNKTRELRTYYSSGSDDSPDLKNFRHRLQPSDLFNKLLQKPVSLRLQRSNYNQIWTLLPGNFKQACGADEFFMMSIFADKKPVALLYADCGISNKHLSDPQYIQFKQLCAAVGQCLQQLSRR